MELFKLLGTIAIDNEEANKNIEQTTGKSKTLGEKLKSGIATAAKWGAALAAAGAAAAVGLGKVVMSAADAADAIDEMSQKIGISREAYQELDYICSQNGMSVDQLQTGVKTLTDQMQAAADGTASAVSTFEKLGVSVYDSTGALKSQETMLWEAMSALQGMENQTEKAALASDLFGRSATELMPILNGSAGSIEEMREQARELGYVLSDEAIDAGANFADTLVVVKGALSKVGTELGIAVMPILQKALDWVLANMPKIRKVATETFNNVKAILSSVKPYLEKGLNWVATNMPKIRELVNWAFTAIQTRFSATMTVIKEAWENIGQPIWNLIQDCVGILKDAFAEKMPEISEFVSQCFADISDFWENHLQPCFEAIGQFIENVLAPAFKFVFEKIIAPVVSTTFDSIKTFWNDTLKPVFTGIIDFLTGVFSGDWGKAWDGIVSIASGIFNGIVNAIRTPIEFINNLLHSFFDPIANWINTSVVAPISNFFSNLWASAQATWQNIKTAITTPIEEASTKIKAIIDKIVGFFNVKITWPKIPLPHFSITPSGWGIKDLLRGVKPTLGISWYAKAMNNPLLLTKPTIFGYDPTTGDLMGGGEKGNEVVSGADTLMKMIGAAVESKVAEQNERMIAVLTAILEAVLTGNQDLIQAVLADKKWSVGEREFARLVKQYA